MKIEKDMVFSVTRLLIAILLLVVIIIEQNYHTESYLYCMLFSGFLSMLMFLFNVIGLVFEDKQSFLVDVINYISVFLTLGMIIFCIVEVLR